MVAMVLSESAVSALKIAGPMFFLGMQGASVSTAINILKDKSVGGLNVLPFASLLTNCVIWTYYGALRNDPTVLIPNAIGVASGLACVGAYQKHTSTTPKGVYAGAMAIMLFATALAFAGNFQLIGSIGCVLAVILMGSPLSTLKTVFATKSTASLPFGTSFMGWCNSLSWSAYGLLVAHDIMIYGSFTIHNTLHTRYTSFSHIPLQTKSKHTLVRPKPCRICPRKHSDGAVCDLWIASSQAFRPKAPLLAFHSPVAVVSFSKFSALGSLLCACAFVHFFLPCDEQRRKVRFL